MPWQEVDKVSLRHEFVNFALDESANMRELCRRFGISPKTGYKWLHRYVECGPSGLPDRSRRPQNSPSRTPKAIEDEVLKVRFEHPAWGGRKIRARLLHLGQESVPSASTITEILRRHDILDPEKSCKHQAKRRFEYSRPNQLWQMDFKGHFPVGQYRCHPLTILDDHSRYNLGLFACKDQRRLTVEKRLSVVFRRYGLPEKMLMDNGQPWGLSHEHPHTRLTVWLMHLGIRVIHGRPYHPQTQGKEERFHRTLKAEVLRYETFGQWSDCQPRFDRWRHVYNHDRPHEALGMSVPASRYRSSPRSFPEKPPQIEYGPGDQVRKVQDGGWLSFKGRQYQISRAFKGHRVALRHTTQDGLMEVFFCQFKIGQIDMKKDAKK